MVNFEGKERRMPKIEACLKEYGFASLEDAQAYCAQKGIDCESIVKGIQPIAFENAVWAYTLGTAIALKKGAKTAADAAEAIGIAIHSQEPPVWILSTRLIPCYDGGPQKCGRRDKKQEPLHQQRLWLCKKTGINSRDACSYEQLRTSASA